MFLLQLVESNPLRARIVRSNQRLTTTKNGIPKGVTHIQRLGEWDRTRSTFKPKAHLVKGLRRGGTKGRLRRGDFSLLALGVVQPTRPLDPKQVARSA